jgi:hypothetical protein
MKFLLRGVFQNVIGFGTRNFIPHTAWSLLTKLIFKHTVNRRSIKQAIRVLLTEESNLGTHTDIYVYYSPTEQNPSWSLIRYTWANISTKPFTVDKPVQCPKCFRMPGTVIHKASKPLNQDVVIVNFKCRSCDWEKAETASGKILDLKNAYSITTRLDKNWSADNGEWCYELMDLTV